MYGTLTCLASSTCSRVCGIGPSTALTHQDGAVHLRRAGDHVLDVVGVTRAVDVRVVAVRRRVLDVAGRDRQNLGRVAPSLRLGGLGDLVVRDELRPALVRRHLGQRGRQRGLAVVDVADGANVDVRFGTIEFLFCHVVVPSSDCVSTASCLPPVGLVVNSVCPASRFRQPAGRRLAPSGARRARLRAGLPTVARCRDSSARAKDGADDRD